MLSLSFFFDKSESTISIVHLINNVLIRGGYFFGLSIDGNHVIEYFNNSNLYKSIFTPTVYDFEIGSPYPSSTPL